jgi:hypothetical protein
MPFDMTPTDAPLERRRRLIAALRSEMPSGFKWNFLFVHEKRACGTVGCALGLAKEIGILDEPLLSDAANKFNLSREQANLIFYPPPHNIRRIYGCAFSKVTPAMVADALERTL